MSYGTCIGKERFRTKYDSSDTVDVQLVDGEIVRKLNILEKRYNSIESGEKFYLLNLKTLIK